MSIDGYIVIKFSLATVRVMVNNIVSFVQYDEMKVFRTRVSEGLVKRQTFLSDALRHPVQCFLFDCP